MKTNVKIAAIVGTLSLSLARNATVPVSGLTTITTAIRKDFSKVDEIRTVHLSDESDDRLDFIVIGGSRRGGFKVEVLRLKHRSITQRWSSDLSMRGVEFERSGPKNVNVWISDEDYEVVIEGCAQHMCGDGISGFLVFSGKEGKAYTAKLVTQGLDRSPTEPPHYDVTFSKGVTVEARKTLEDAICSSTGISSKRALPFPCNKQ